LTQWHHERSYAILRQSLAANRAAWWMADLVHHMIAHDDPHEDVFAALSSALDAIDRGDAVPRALLDFQWTLLCSTGYQPQVLQDAETGRPIDPAARTLGFSAAAGGVVADTGAPDRWRLRGETVRVLQSLSAGEGVRDAPADVLERANRLLAAYFREIIGSEPAAYGYAWGKRLSD
jgi:recombinational DNA repair protein (RecF pathway)